MSSAVAKKVADVAPRLARTLRTSTARASGGHDVSPAYSLPTPCLLPSQQRVLVAHT